MNPTEVFSFTDGLGIDGETVWLEQAPFAAKVDLTTHDLAQRPTGRSVLVSGGSRGLQAMDTESPTSPGPARELRMLGSQYLATLPTLQASTSL